MDHEQRKSPLFELNDGELRSLSATPITSPEELRAALLEDHTSSTTAIKHIEEYLSQRKQLRDALFRHLVADRIHVDNSTGIVSIVAESIEEADRPSRTHKRVRPSTIEDDLESEEGYDASRHADRSQRAAKRRRRDDTQAQSMVARSTLSTVPAERETSAVSTARSSTTSLSNFVTDDEDPSDDERSFKAEPSEEPHDNVEDELQLGRSMGVNPARGFDMWYSASRDWTAGHLPGWAYRD